MHKRVRNHRNKPRKRPDKSFVIETLRTLDEEYERNINPHN